MEVVFESSRTGYACRGWPQVGTIVTRNIVVYGHHGRYREVVWTAARWSLGRGFAKPLEGVPKVIEDISKVIEGISKVIEGVSKIIEGLRGSSQMPTASGGCGLKGVRRGDEARSEGGGSAFVPRRLV